MRTSIFVVLLVMSLTACNNDTNQYDSGYEAAWDGKKEPSSIWSTKNQRNGYQDGIADAHMYDEGYYDGKNKHKPKYFNDVFYMDGFKDGKKQRL
ncbi:MAG: hypothetical protein RSB82_04895 [Victivallaceae bacterium]